MQVGRRVDLHASGMPEPAERVAHPVDDAAVPTEDHAAVAEVTEPSAVTVYWRPGCPFCSSLRRGLRRAGVATTEVDIWADPHGAEVVRGVTGGDETVPTVAVGGTHLVNPSTRAVLRAAGIDPPRRLPWRRPRPTSD